MRHFPNVAERVDAIRRADTENRASDRETETFREDEGEQFASPEAERLENRQFAETFAHGHAHRAGGDEHEREHHHRADGSDERLDVAQHGDEAELEIAFTFCAHLGGAVGEGVVDGLDDAGHIVSRFHLEPPHADEAGCADGFIQIFLMKHHHAVVRRAGENPGDLEFQRTGINRARQRETIAHLEFIFIRRHLADDGGRFFRLIRGELGVGEFQIGEDATGFFGVHAELRERHRALVLELAAEPGERRDAFDAGNFFDDAALTRGQGIGERNLVARADAEFRPGTFHRQRQFAQRHLQRHQQKQARRDARHGKQRAPLIADRVLEDERRKRHVTFQPQMDTDAHR